jgi:hypothetical protein
MKALVARSLLAVSAGTLLGIGLLPAAHASADDAFTGTWVSTDTDGSHQTLTVHGAAPSQRAVTYLDDVATQACNGAAATIKGHGSVDGDAMVLSGSLRCEPGTRPLRGVTVTFQHQADDTLLDGFGITWTRA